MNNQEAIEIIEQVLNNVQSNRLTWKKIEEAWEYLKKKLGEEKK